MSEESKDSLVPQVSRWVLRFCLVLDVKSHDELLATTLICSMCFRCNFSHTFFPAVRVCLDLLVPQEREASLEIRSVCSFLLDTLHKQDPAIAFSGSFLHHYR